MGLLCRAQYTGEGKDHKAGDICLQPASCQVSMGTVRVPMCAYHAEQTKRQFQYMSDRAGEAPLRIETLRDEEEYGIDGAGTADRADAE